MAVTAGTLLDELEGLDHHHRVRRMIEIGRAARADAGLRTLLAGMAGADWFQRLLAVYAGYGTRDAAAVAAAAADPSRTVRGTALQVLAVIGDDDLVAGLLAGLSGTAQRRYAGRLARRGRHRPVDVVLRALAAGADPAAARLLHLGSAETAAELAPAVLPAAGWTPWRRLTEHHPEVAAAALREAARAAQGPDALLAFRAGAVLGPLGDRRPDLALELIDLLGDRVPAPALDRLAVRRPVEAADLVLGPRRAARFPAAPAALRGLDTERLVRLAVDGKLRPSARLLRRLPPAARMALHRETGAGWADESGAAPVEWLALLDRPTREAEARRHLALPRLRTRPERRLPYAALLPWEEAAAELGPDADDPDPDRRAAALGALVGVARFHPDRLPAALALVVGRGREQDPVRHAMVAALSALPRSRWRAEHLDGLARVVRAALDAVDCSSATAAAVQRLVVGIAPAHPEWAGPQLAAVALARGSITADRLDSRLTDADVRRLAPAVAPVLAAWAPRERDPAILAAARALGRRLRVFDELAEQVVQVAWLGDAAAARAAVGLVAAELPGRSAALVPELLAADPTWAAVGVVAGFLHRHRQDLLTPHLGRTAHRGRFGTGRSRLLPGFRSGFHRWTPAQQREFARSLAEVVRDPDRDTAAVLGAVATLAALPAVAPDAVLAGIAAVDGRQPARDAALRGLAGHDSGAGIPLLLAALDDERAPVAVYALRPAVLELPVARALEVLRGIDSPRLTVAKEVARLLGELPGGAGYPDLLALATTSGLHRDLRVAVLRGLWNHLDDERTWPVLHAAAADPDPAVAGAVVRIPVDRARPVVRRRMLDLLAALVAHPSERVRIEALRRCAADPLSDPDRVLGPPLLGALDSPLLDQVDAAAAAVLATYAGRDPDRVGAAVARVLADRAALAVVLDRLVSSARWHRSRYAATTAAVLDRLDTDPLTAARRPVLALAVLGPAAAATRLRAQAADGSLHADALAAAVAALAGGSRPDRTFQSGLEARLSADPDERLRRIALAALVAAAAGPKGWTPERRRRLDAFRADPSPLVAGAAQFTFPPDAT